MEQYIDAPNGRRLPKFRLKESIDDPWSSVPEPIGADADGEIIPF